MAIIGGDVQIKNWSRFGQSKGLVDVVGAPLVACDSGGSVAAAAVNAAGLNLSSFSAGGDLGSMDIKRMDVKTAISMSLMQKYITSGELFELIADGDGSVRFVKVGDSAGGIGKIYYSVQTTSYSNPITDVMVTGGKPLPEIKFGSWYNVLKDKEIYAQQTMFENCRKNDFQRYATILFVDPHLDTTYKDGIDNLYDIDNPWERLIGYVHYKNPGQDLTLKPDVKIDWTSQASIPIQVASLTSTELNFNSAPIIDMGTIENLEQVDITTPAEAGCWTGRGKVVDYKKGIKIEIPAKWRYTSLRNTTLDRFQRVSAVYLVGAKIENLFYAPKSIDKMFNTLNPPIEDCALWASISKDYLTTFKCEEGKHYAIGFETDPAGKKIPYIVFGKDVRRGDPFPYGKNTTFKLDPYCKLALSQSQTGTIKEYTGTIFPVTKTEGIWVFDIWAVVDIETPAINITDPDGEALKIAEMFEYNICPISVIDEPAPIATATMGLIGQESMQKDNDPTKVQNMQDNDLEKAMDKMQGAGMSVSFSFLDKTQVASAATNLYKLMADKNGYTSVETVYTCGPNSNPQLGAGIYGGVINAIRYSYTDQGSYTVSVTVGPMLTPSSIVQVDGGPAPMAVEEVSAKGIVIASNGDNINFKVRIDGLGDRWAVCMTPNIVRIGDVVQCTVHNNPVEY